MKWFKHISTTYQDEKIAKVIDVLGIEGYGFWWRMLEVVAEKMENNETEISYPIKYFANIFGFSEKKFEKFLKIFQSFEIFFVNFEKKQNNFSKKSQTVVTVNIPNLLKYRDEYTEKKCRKSGQTPDTIGTNSAPEIETELNINNISKKGGNIKINNINISSPNPPLTDFSNSQEKQETQDNSAGVIPPKEYSQDNSPEQQPEKPKREPSGYFKQLRAVYNKYRNEGRLAGWEEFTVYEKDKSNPDVLSLLEDIEARSQTDQWKKGYVPKLAKYLKEKMWEVPIETLQDFKKANEQPEDFVAFKKRLEEKQNGNPGISKHDNQNLCSVRQISPQQ